uniref:Uncharacterized protein n=1 Tax=viral metagenome TaxID=1070528 RepID=A0A6C0IVN0_9ZZZZ
MDLVLLSGFLGSLAYFKNREEEQELDNKYGWDDENINLETSYGNRAIPILNKTNQQTIKIEKEFNDLNRELKGLCTDIIVNDFFLTDNSLFNFLMLVYNMFEKNIEKYIEYKSHMVKGGIKKNDIFFTFKGGNILRIISKELIMELPDLAGKKINDFYKKFFKRSDADFSIYINPELEDYDKIYNDWCLISYHLQYRIREIINNNLTDYFDYFKYNNGYKQEILKKNLKEFNNSNSVKDIDNTKYYKANFTDLILKNTSVNQNNYDSLKDFITEFSEKDSELNRSDLTEKDNFMYISLNKTLEFKSGDGGITKFALIRTKINFNLILEKNKNHSKINIGGELIDVSIPHRKDESIKEVFNNMDKAISRYNITNKDKTLKFNSYSLEFLIEDLEKILFHVAEYPWDDNKYVKRLNRLCYLYFLEMFIDIKDNSLRKTKLNEMINKIKIDSIKPKDVNQKIGEKVKHFDRLYWYYNYIGNKLNKNLQLQMKEFIDNIHINLKILSEGFNDVELYCKNGPGNLSESDIYTTSMDNLV